MQNALASSHSDQTHRKEPESSLKLKAVVADVFNDQQQHRNKKARRNQQQSRHIEKRRRETKRSLQALDITRLVLKSCKLCIQSRWPKIMAKRREISSSGQVQQQKGSKLRVPRTATRPAKAARKKRSTSALRLNQGRCRSGTNWTFAHLCTDRPRTPT